MSVNGIFFFMSGWEPLTSSSSSIFLRFFKPAVISFIPKSSISGYKLKKFKYSSWLRNVNGVTSMSELEKLGLLGVKVFEEMPECEFEWLECGDGRWTWGHIYMGLLRSV